MLEWVKSTSHFQEIRQKHKDFFAVMFYGSFSPNAQRGLKEIEVFSRENEKVPVYVVDVEKIKGLHKDFGIKKVPTVAVIKNGRVSFKIEGVENAKFYERVILGAKTPSFKKDGRPVSHRVIVYTGQGCPACSMVKSYLRRRGVNFKEIDVSRDQSAAQALISRSGQMAVPQIDIDGNLIVGFDQAKIDSLLN